MKDARGHGSNKKPIPNSPYHAKSNAELRYIIKDASEAEKATRGMSMYDPNSGKRQDTAGKYSDQVNDASTVLAYRDRGGKQDAPGHGLIEGMQAKLSGDIAAGRMLHSGTGKSDAAPVHDAMTQKRLSDARGSMSRLSDTFHAGGGNNRGGEYGRSVREAYDRHAAVVHEITGKRPNIYDR